MGESLNTVKKSDGESEPGVAPVTTCESIIRGTHHTAIICSDYLRSRHFYVELLGLEVISEHYRAERQSWKLDLRLPDKTQIELFSFAAPPRRATYPEACGLRHLAFRVEDIGDAARVLNEFGILVREIRTDERTGLRFLFIEDPDGLPIEFYETGERSPHRVSPSELRIDRFINDTSSLPALDAAAAPWTAVQRIGQIVRNHLAQLVRNGDSSELYVDPTATIERGVTIKSPAYIGPHCFLGSGAYLRGGVFLDKEVCVGPGCEIKSSIIFERTALAHFNFVGDSIIGPQVNFEAGAHTANHWNERSDKTICVMTSDGPLSTECSKFGSIIGDHSRIGANAVLSPGTLLEPHSIVPRLTLVQQTELGNTKM